MQCSKCQNPVTSHWLTQSDPPRLECPSCGTGMGEPYPDLPVIGWVTGTGERPWRRWRRLILICCLVALVAPLLLRLLPDDGQVAAVSDSDDILPQVADIRAIEKPAPSAHGQAKRATAKTAAKAKAKSLAKQPAPPPVPPKKREPHQYILPKPASKGSAKRPAAGRPRAARHPKGKTSAQPGGVPKAQLPPVLFASRSPVRAASVYWPKLILASCHADETICLWDLRSRDAKLREVKSESGTPMDLAFHPTGGPLAVVAHHSVTFYSVPELDKIGALESAAELSSCAFSNNGAYLAAAQTERGVLLRILSTFEIVGRLPAYGGTQAVAWSAQGGELMVASTDNAVRLWDPDRLDTPVALPGHMDWVSCLAVARDVRRAVTGSWDYSARAWDLNTRACISTLPSHRQRPTVVAITTDGRLAASGDKSGAISIWNPSTGVEACALHGHAGPITALAFHGDRLILSSSQDGSARTWGLTDRLQWPTADLTTQQTDSAPRISRYAAALAEANRLARSGDHTGAIAQARQAAALRPDYVEAHLNLAEHHRSAGQHREAITSYKEALKLRPKSGWLWYRLGSLLSEVDQGELAIGALELACSMLPDLLPARLSLGTSLLQAKRYEDAKGAFETAMKTQPNSPEIHDGLGQSYAGLGDWETAIKHYRRAIDIKRDHAPAYSNLIDALLAAGPEHATDAQNWAQLAGNLGIELRPDTRDRLKRIPNTPEQ